MKTYSLILLLSVLLSPVYAQPILVKEIPQGTHSHTGTTNLLYFLSENSDTLWRSNGTDAGTFILKTGLNNARSLTAAGNRLYFVDDGIMGNRLWTSNGNISGTASIANHTEISSLHPFGSLLVFAAQNSNGRELWKSNGTSSGTVMIKDINPGISNGLSANTEMETVNGYFYFPATNGINGIELWKSDGTSSGTAMVIDILSGSGSSTPFNLIKVGSLLFFDTQDPDNIMWKTDGTTAGTNAFFDYGTIGYDRRWESVDINGVLYFFLGNPGGQDPWKSDGTTSGTVPLDFIYSYGAEMFNADGILVLSNFYEEYWNLYYHLGVPDDFIPIADGYFEHSVITLENYVFYNQDDGDIYNFEIDFFRELWQTTVPGGAPAMVKDLFPFLNTSYEWSDNFTVIGNTLYFTTNNHSSSWFLYKYTPMEFGINSFTLVNSNTDMDIMPLKNGDTIYTDQHVNIRANTFGTVNSVKFFVNDNPFSLESVAPFALAGDNSGNYNEWMKPTGIVEIRAVPYTGSGATGTAGTPAEFTVHILNPSDTVSSQISFTLVNAVTDTDIGPLTDGQVINLAGLPTNKLNIRANSSMPGTESVVFDFNGVMNYWTENTEPYALFGDNSGNYNQWTAVTGTHNLTATPYTGNFGAGTAGTGTSISFTIINTASKISALESYPNPAEDQVTIQLSEHASGTATVIISDLSGKEYYSGQAEIESGNLNLGLIGFNMKPGIYIIKLQSDSQSGWIKFVKK